MSIDNNIIPSIIYLLYDAHNLKNNSNMSDEKDGMVHDNHHEEDLPFYDAENANANDVTIANLDNNDNIKPSGEEVENGSITHDYVIVDDNNDLEICNNEDDGEVVVVTDGSITTAPSSYMKKKQKNVVPNTSPFRSSPRISRLRPNRGSTPTKSNVISNKRKLDSSTNRSPKSKKCGSTNSTPSKKKSTNTTTSSTITTPVKKKTPIATTNTKKKSPPGTVLATIKASEDEYTDRQMKAFEKEIIEDRIKYADDPIALKKIERTFHQKLVNIQPRNSSSNKVSSVVWKYCKVIKLTEYAESLYKRGKNCILRFDFPYNI